MPEDQIVAFREVYHALQERESDGEYWPGPDWWHWPKPGGVPAPLVSVWHERVAPALRPRMERLVRYRRRTAPIDPESEPVEDSWDLYALSRLAEYLLGDLREYGSPRSAAQALDADSYGRLFEAIGLERLGTVTYNPFFHEVVDMVERPEWPAARVEIEHEFWPGLLWGELLMLRSGVRVACSPALMRRGIATRSTLYFAHLRCGRKTVDESDGWGHNSQWRTRLRRFYADERGLHFNVDGTVDIASPESLAESVAQAVRDRHLPDRAPPDPNADLPLDMRRELLTNRCLVRTEWPGRDDDFWPWHDTLTLPGGGGVSD